MELKYGNFDGSDKVSVLIHHGRTLLLLQCFWGRVSSIHLEF